MSGSRVVPIQFGWSFLSDREKRRITGIAKATYTAKVQAGKSVIKITTSQSAAVATNAIGISLVNRSDLLWSRCFLASYAAARRQPDRWIDPPWVSRRLDNFAAVRGPEGGVESTM